MKKHSIQFLANALFTLSVSHTSAQTDGNEKASQPLKITFGIKAGLNVVATQQFKTVDQTLRRNVGFFIGGYYAMPAKRLGYGTELILSRQGYDY